MANIEKASTAALAREMVDSVQEKITALEEGGGINFPPNYSVANALRTAWLQIQEVKDLNNRPALEVCTRESIANALLYTVVQGLSPAKKQVYYIVYGNQLQAQRSYFGTMAATKRIPGVLDVWADVVYEGDKFSAQKIRGGWQVVTHESLPENIDPEKIKYAYAVIEREGAEPYTEIMNWAQIQNSWSKSRSKAQTVHKEFPDQMAKRTVINRACKMFFNASDDSDMMIEAFNATGDQYDNSADAVTKAPAQERAKLNALNDELNGGTQDVQQ